MDVTFVAPSSPHPVGGVVAIYQFANGLRRRGHRVHVVHLPWMGQRIAGLDDLAWFTFEDGVEHHRCETLDEPHLPTADFVFSGLAPARMGLPLFLVQGQSMFTRDVEDAVWQGACPKICIARWLVEAGRAAGVPDHQLVYVPYGLDHARFRVTRPMEDRPARVAMLAHAAPAKGFASGLRALHLVHEAEPAAELVLFGTEPRPAELPEWIDFRFAPPPQELVDDVYNGSRVFLCPSLLEGFGFPSIEAMACGCALVSTANGGSDDFAVDGETALVARAGDAAGLAERVVALLRDDARRLALAHAGRAFVQRFDWDASAERLERFLAEYGADPDHYRRPAHRG